MGVSKKPAKTGPKRVHPPVSAEAARIGMEIIKARGERTQQEIADQLDISFQAISKIEGGRTNPDDPRARRTLKRLAELFNNDFGVGWLTEHLKTVKTEAAGRGVRPPINKTVFARLYQKHIKVSSRGRQKEFEGILKMIERDYDRELLDQEDNEDDNSSQDS